MDNHTKLSASINFDKCDMDWVHQGKQGKYLNLTIFLREHPDQYGNSGFIVQQASKEAYQQGKRGAIVGNIKMMQLPPNAQPIPTMNDNRRGNSYDNEEELPF